MHQRFVRPANLNERDDLCSSKDVIWLMRHPGGSLTRSGWLREQYFCFNCWAAVSGGAGPPRKPPRCFSPPPGRSGAPAGQPSTCFGRTHKESRQECPGFPCSKPVHGPSRKPPQSHILGIY
jgi:hypothetical protein